MDAVFQIAGEMTEMNKLYRDLIVEYRADILSSIKSPTCLVKQLEVQRVGANEIFIQELNLDPSRRRRNEVVYKILRSTSLSQIRRMIKALEMSKETDLLQIFNIIWWRVNLVLHERKISVSFDPPVNLVQQFKIASDGDENTNTNEHDESQETEHLTNRNRLKETNGLSNLDSTLKPEFDFSLHFAARTHNIRHLQELLKSHKKKNWLYNGRTPLHDAFLGGSSKEAHAFVKCLLDHVKEQDELDLLENESREKIHLSAECPWTLSQFVDMQEEGNDLNTAMHMAVQRESTELIQLLFSYSASFNIPNEKGQTALKQMYEKTPGALIKILDGQVWTNKDFASDGDLKISIDFLPVVGNKRGNETQEFDRRKRKRKESEMSLLANLVFRNFQASAHFILSHVVVKAFLELKWNKLKWHIWTSVFFYVLIHIFSLVFVVNLFVIEFPYPDQFSKNPHGISMETHESARVAQSVNHTSRNSLVHYLFGKWNVSSSEGFIPPSTSKIPGFLNGWAWSLLFIAVILLIIESMEIVVIAQITAKGRHNIKTSKKVMGLLVWRLIVPAILIFIGFRNKFFTEIVLIYVELFVFLIIVVAAGTALRISRRKSMRRRKLKSGHTECSCRCFGTTSLKAFRTVLFSMEAYLHNLENLFQLAFIFSSVHVAGVIWQKEISETYYVMAAWSVLITGGSILLQIGNIYELGEYVHMLKAVLKNFLSIMLTYFILFITFAIAYAIVFSEEKFFLTLPGALSRFLPMLGGEFNYDSLLYGSRGPLNEDAGFLTYGRHSVQAAFNFVMSIVLINLLIGLTVSDVAKIRKKSDVLHRSIQVERLYTMENIMSMWLLRKLFSCGQSIHVFPNEGENENDLVVQLNLRKDLSRELRQEFRRLLSAAENEDD